VVSRPVARSSASRFSELYVSEALDRVAVDEAGPGEIIAVAGIAEITSARRWPTPTIPARCR
jgi:GTP-binding protein